MRLVIALGGNALLRRGEAMTAENQRENVRIACEQIAKVAPGNELVIAHGNGPQVGLLALQGNAYDPSNPYPLDVLGAETEGMIGYMIEQELGNLLPFEVPFATILTQVEVDCGDPAFKKPTKPIGPVYSKEDAERLAAAAVALIGVSLAVIWFRDNNVDPSSNGERIVEAAEAPLRRSFVPVGGAAGVGVVLAGLATKPAVFKAGVLLLVAVVAEWIYASIHARSAHGA